MMQDADASMIYREEVPYLDLFYFTMSKNSQDKLRSRFTFQVSSSLYKICGTKLFLSLMGTTKLCPWAKIMTCWALFLEEPPQDMVWIDMQTVESLISCHHKVLNGWMISRKVYAPLKPSDQPRVRCGGVSPPRGKGLF